MADSTLRFPRAALKASALAIALSACTVGPDFVRPQVPVPGSFVEAPQTPVIADGQANRPSADARFWESFGDPQLTALAEPGSGIANVHLDAVEHRDREGTESLVFMHAVKGGPADRSFGLQVAALAGLPKVVVRRARARLAELEQQGRDAPRATMAAEELDAPKQIGLFAPSHAALEALAALSKVWSTDFNYTDFPEDEGLRLANGAYIMTEMVADQFVTLEANPEYQGERVPQAERGLRNLPRALWAMRPKPGWRRPASASSIRRPIRRARRPRSPDTARRRSSAAPCRRTTRGR